MTTETLQFDIFDRMLAEGRIIRNKWTDRDAQGRELACWLAALYPPVGEKQDASACPAALMRPWLAQLVPWLDDAGTDAAWPGHTQRFARAIRGVVALDDAADDKLSRAVRVICVREALSHVTADEWGVRDACQQTIAALESGDHAAAWAAARAAEDAARAAEDAAWAARDAWAAAGAARAAAWAARDAWAARAARAARDAAGVAVRAAEAAGAAGAARDAWAAEDAARDAEDAAGDRMVDAILSAFEHAVRA